MLIGFVDVGMAEVGIHCRRTASIRPSNTFVCDNMYLHCDNEDKAETFPPDGSFLTSYSLRMSDLRSLVQDREVEHSNSPTYCDIVQLIFNGLLLYTSKAKSNILLLEPSSDKTRCPSHIFLIPYV